MNDERFQLEQRIVGILLQHPEYLSDCHLTDGHFTDELYRLIFIDIKAQLNTFGKVDLFLMIDRCPKVTLPDLLILRKETVGASNFDYYVNLILDDEKLERFRALIESAHTYLNDGQQKKDPEKLANRLMTRLLTISGDDNRKTGFNMEDMCRLYVNESQVAQERVGDGESLYGVPTGIDDLDVKTSGLQKKKFYVFGGRPSMGKSSLGECLAVNCGNAGHGCGYFAIEPSDVEMSFRIISKYTRVNSNAIKSRALEDHELTAITGGISRGKDKNINFHIDEDCTVGSIVARCIQWKMQGDLDLIVIDYLQYVKPEKKGRNRLEELSEISRQLKYLAKKLDVAVVALVQLNRNVDGRSNKRPITSDIRECGGIEQDADFIGLLYRDSVYNDDADLRDGEIIVVKNRDGEIGTVYAKWDPKITEWSNKDARPVYQNRDTGQPPLTIIRPS